MLGMQVDVQDAQAVEAFAKRVREEFADLNVLVNNAGISRSEDLTNDLVDFSVTRSIVDTNVLSVLQLTAALLPLLKAQSDSTVITTTSGLAFVPLAAFPTYCASKAFLHSWLQSLRFQLRDTSVKVLELAPPYVQTELGGPSQATDPHAMPLADYVAEVMHLLTEADPPSGEILVERVKALRFAEQGERYSQVFAVNNRR
jgi:uncharacterized oxidoreductase